MGGPVRLAPSKLARAAKSIVNKAAHRGIVIDPQAELDEINAAIKAEAANAEEGLDRARVHSLRVAAVDLGARLAERKPKAVEPTPEELDAECQAWLECRGAVVTWPEHAFTLPAGETGPKVGT